MRKCKGSQKLINKSSLTTLSSIQPTSMQPRNAMTHVSKQNDAVRRVLSTILFPDVDNDGDIKGKYDGNEFTVSPDEVDDDDNDGPSSPVLTPQIRKPHAETGSKIRSAAKIDAKRDLSDTSGSMKRRLHTMSVLHAKTTCELLRSQHARHQAELRVVRASTAGAMDGMQSVAMAQRRELTDLRKEFHAAAEEHRCALEQAADREATRDAEIVLLKESLRSLRRRHAGDLRRRALEADRRLDQLGRLLSRMVSGSG
jgi:hypothetical protein